MFTITIVFWVLMMALALRSRLTPMQAVATAAVATAGFFLALCTLYVACYAIVFAAGYEVSDFADLIIRTLAVLCGICGGYVVYDIATNQPDPVLRLKDRRRR